MGKCDCCGSYQSKITSYSSGNDSVNICFDCLEKILEYQRGKIQLQEVITKHSAPELVRIVKNSKNSFLKQEKKAKNRTSIQVISKAANLVNTVGGIISIVNIVAGVGFILSLIFGDHDQYDGIIYLGLGMAAIISGIFTKLFCNCLAIITENQYRELLKKQREES